MRVGYLLGLAAVTLALGITYRLMRERSDPRWRARYRRIDTGPVQTYTVMQLIPPIIGAGV